MCLNQINQYYYRLNTLIQIMVYTAMWYYKQSSYSDNIGSFITSDNFIMIACEKCGKCWNAISVIVTEAVV